MACHRKQPWGLCEAGLMRLAACWLGLGWIQRATTGRFRTEAYGSCCEYLSRSPCRAAAGFLNYHGISLWGGRAKAIADGQAGLPSRDRDDHRWSPLAQIRTSADRKSVV